MYGEEDEINGPLATFGLVLILCVVILILFCTGTVLFAVK